MNTAQITKLERAWTALSAEAVSYPLFTLAFEEVVQATEDSDPSIGGRLRRIWGQVELINALSLDENVPVSSGEISQTAEYVEQALQLLRTGPRGL